MCSDFFRGSSKKLLVKPAFIFNIFQFRLIFYSYLLIGIFQAAAGFHIYFWIMAEHGWTPARLLFIKKEWEDPELDISDVNGRYWVSLRIYR